MNMQEVVQQEIKRCDEARDALMNHPKIRPFVRSVDKWVKKTQGRPATVYEKRNVAQCLYNCIMEAGVRQNSRVFEASTGQDNISFLGIQLPVISALLPTLVLNDIAVVQAIDRRIAAVFYLNVLHGTAKGEATEGGTMMSAKTGHAVGQSERQFAMARVSRELLGTGNAVYSGTTSTNPGLINLENVKVEALIGSTYTLIATCTEAGVLVSDVGVSGTINVAGVYSITVTSQGSAALIKLTYEYQYDIPRDVYNDRDGVPETTIEVTQSAVEAIDFPLRAKWSLGAQFDLQKAHGIDLESELTTFLGGEIRFTIDQEGLRLIDEAAESVDAATQVTDWDARPSEGEAWYHKKSEFLDRIQEGSNAIFEKTKRGTASFMVCGNNVARVIKQLGKDHFTPAPFVKQPTGPIKIGVLDNQVTIIQNPFKSTNRYTLGFRGPDYLNAGFIYAPYIPLFSTPTLTTNDLMSQKGFLSSAAFKVINAGLFTYGDITNLMGGYVVGS